MQSKLGTTIPFIGSRLCLRTLSLSSFLNITTDEVGNAAVYLLSDLSSGVTGEIHDVDSGFNTIAL